MNQRLKTVTNFVIKASKLAFGFTRGQSTVAQAFIMIGLLFYFSVHLTSLLFQPAPYPTPKEVSSFPWLTRLSLSDSTNNVSA